MNKIQIFFLIFVLFGSSCMHNRIRYIQDDKELVGVKTEYPNLPENYIIQKNDILYIKILSNNADLNQLFNSTSSMVNNMAIIGNYFYLNGLTVNDSGNIFLPVVGDLYVEGKTVNEIRLLVAEKISERINHSEVVVYLVSFNLTFIGEFNTQGKLTIMQENINILDAIALAGGITDYGNKKNILIVRQTNEGTRTFRLDITQRSLLSSKDFYLMPNDIIIAEPLKNKSFQLGIRDYSLVLTTVTSTITMVLLVINLLK